MNLFKKTLIAVAASLAFAGAAQSTPVSSQFFAGFQQLSDNSAESQSVDLNTNGRLDVGDVLSGIFTIETIEKSPNPTRLLGTGGVNELTGIFSVVVAQKIDIAYETTYNAVLASTGNAALAAATASLVAGTSGFDYVFAPYAGFTGTYGAGAAVVLFDDSSVDYTRVKNGTCTDVATCTATASDGTHWMTLGFDGSLSNFWAAHTATDNISVIGAVPAPGNGGTFNVGLNILENYSGLSFANVGCLNGAVNVCGSGSLLGTGGVNTPFQSFDNVDFTVNVAVPEPATLGLVGLGLLGIGGLGARRRKAV